MPNVYPDTTNPSSYNMVIEPIQEMLIMDSGAIQINTPHPVRRRSFSFDYSNMDEEHGKELIEFYDANSDGEFYFFDQRVRSVTWSNCNVAVGDGVTTVFSLPGKSIAGWATYHDGVIASPQPTLSSGTGSSGEDVVTYGSAPGNGVSIALTATSIRRRHTCVFTRNPAERWQEAKLTSISMGIMESI